MFIVVVAVPDDAPSDVDRQRIPTALRARWRCSTEPSTQRLRCTRTERRLFLVRLLDTTQVAIDVGRERMGTDKRPGPYRDDAERPAALRRDHGSGRPGLVTADLD